MLDLKAIAIQIRHARDTLGVMRQSPNLNADERALLTNALIELYDVIMEMGFTIHVGREIPLDLGTPENLTGWKAYL